MNEQIGRLALREEGENWNAYYAKTDTMEDAIFLGSIRMGIIVLNPERKQEFMDLMRNVVVDIIEEVSGVRPWWKDPQPAPENERSGHA